jgi:hypothetical protein
VSEWKVRQAQAARGAEVRVAAGVKSGSSGDSTSKDMAVSPRISPAIARRGSFAFAFASPTVRRIFSANAASELPKIGVGQQRHARLDADRRAAFAASTAISANCSAVLVHLRVAEKELPLG